MVASLSLEESYDYLSSSKITQNNIGKTGQYQATTHHKLCVLFLGFTEKLILLTHWPLGNLNEILDMSFSTGF